jgi:hypothetical protein
VELEWYKQFPQFAIDMDENEEETSITFGVDPVKYGSSYQDHLVEQYKLFVNSAENVSARRLATNNFFLSVNTVVLAFLGIASGTYLAKGYRVSWIVIVAIAGIALCYYWYRLIRSYNNLNQSKFDVIHAIEARLPAAPCRAEWEGLGFGEDKKTYVPFTRVESRVPWVFAFLFLALAIVVVVAQIVRV